MSPELWPRPDALPSVDGFLMGIPWHSRTLPRPVSPGPLVRSLRPPWASLRLLASPRGGDQASQAQPGEPRPLAQTVPNPVTGVSFVVAGVLYKLTSFVAAQSDWPWRTDTRGHLQCSGDPSPAEALSFRFPPSLAPAGPSPGIHGTRTSRLRTAATGPATGTGGIWGEGQRFGGQRTALGARDRNRQPSEVLKPRRPHKGQGLPFARAGEKPEDDRNSIQGPKEAGPLAFCAQGKAKGTSLASLGQGDPAPRQ